jgi:regulator of RNase E activity RraA
MNPGELLHGDRNGVTTIPVELAALVVEGCQAFMTAEAAILDYLKAGNVTVSGYAAARDECKRQIGELGKKLKSAMR